MNWQRNSRPRRPYGMTEMRKAWQEHFLIADGGAALVVAAAFLVWAEFYGGRGIMFTLLKNNFGGLYSTMAVIFGSLLGFMITAASIVITSGQSERFKILKMTSSLGSLMSAFTSSIRVLAIATAAAILGIVWGESSGWEMPAIFYVNAALLSLVIARLWRAICFFEAVIQIAAK